MGTPAELVPQLVNAPRSQPEQLAGDWRVMEVKVAEAPEQRLRDNDPRLVGMILSVSPMEIRWRSAKTGHFAKTCKEPSITENDELLCGGFLHSIDDLFTPIGARLALQEDGRLLLDWFDGARFTLRRN